MLLEEGKPFVGSSYCNELSQKEHCDNASSGKFSISPVLGGLCRAT